LLERPEQAFFEKLGIKMQNRCPKLSTFIPDL
jgi:hypothetical protein